MGLFDEVLCNHELFGAHQGEMHQTKDLHCLGGLLDDYEITPSGRLEFLVYRVEDRSDPTLKGIARWAGSMSRVFTGGRRDLNYHGWLYLSCFGRAKFAEGTMVAFEPEPEQPSESEDPSEVQPSKPAPNFGNEAVERSFCEAAANDSAEYVDWVNARPAIRVFESDPDREFRPPIRSAVIGKTFRMSELPGLNELEAFVREISPAVRSKLAWQINKSLGLDTNAIRQLLEDKSIAEEWLRFEQEPK